MKILISILKKVIYIILIGFHAFLFGYFLYFTYQNIILVIISSIFIASIIFLALYSFLTKKPYYFYFFIGIVIDSIFLIFVFHLTLLVIVPEIVILYLLTIRGPTRSEVYLKTRVKKQSETFHHDPAVSHLYSAVPKSMAFKMDDVWNPDSTKPNGKNNKNLKNYWKIYATIFILVLSFSICAIYTLIYFYS